MTIEDLPYLTRKQAVEFLNGRGYPETLDGLKKACSAGAGPQPTLKYGQRLLYEPAEILAWAVRKAQPVVAARQT